MARFFSLQKKALKKLERYCFFSIYVSWNVKLFTNKSIRFCQSWCFRIAELVEKISNGIEVSSKN